jgi:hypothetical protein
MTPEKRVLLAIESAQDILAQYVAPGKRNAEETMAALLTVLDDDEVVQAVWDLDPKRAHE